MAITLKQNSRPFVKKVIKFKFLKNKFGSLRAHDFPDISILKKKKNLDHLIKIMSREPGVMGVILLKCF